jgi:hypothetical protein
MAVWLATDGESVKGKRPPDFKITIISPATDVHVRKVSRDKIFYFTASKYYLKVYETRGDDGSRDTRHISASREAVY